MESRDHAVPAPLLAEETIATVRRWIDAAAEDTQPPGESRLREFLGDPDGLPFIAGLVDGVLRPTDPRVAGRNLEHVTRRMPASVRRLPEIGGHLAGGFATILPAPIIPIARENVLHMVGHLLVQRDGYSIGGRVLGLPAFGGKRARSTREVGEHFSRDHAAEKHFADLLGTGGIRPIIAPICAATCGQREADRQLADAQELLARPDVNALSISLTDVAGELNLLDLDAQTEEVVGRLVPLYELAAAASESAFINLDVHRFDELEFTVRVFQELCERFPALEAGITLPAYLPDSFAALERIEEWASKRRARGSARVVVRLVKGDHHAQELTSAALHGWQAATFATRQDTETQFIRMLDVSLSRGRCEAVHVVVATHNLFDVAYAWRLAKARGVEGAIEYEFMLGIESTQAAAVKRDVGGIRLYAPVVRHSQLALAVPMIVRRLHELTDADGFLASAHILAASTSLFEREKALFLAALALSIEPSPRTNRYQAPVHAEDTDFATRAGRDWAAAAVLRAKNSLAGEDILASARLRSVEELNASIAVQVSAGQEWGQRRASTRAAVIESAAEVIAEWRGLLVEVAVSESGLTAREADSEVSAAVTLARHAAVSAREMEAVENAKFRPSPLVVVVTPRSGPIAVVTGAVLTALAAGSAVVVKTAPETKRSVAVLLDALRAGGVPEDLLGLVDDEGELAHQLISNPKVSRVVLFGSRHTAKLFHSWRAELNLFATTGGRNAVIVTPSANLETAVADVVASAFDHAGQAATATSAVILVGSVAESDRFRGRLTDAISSLRTGDPSDLSTVVSALARPASGSVLESLETLDKGESWLVRPQRLDDSGRLWSPGLRDGVQAGSAFLARESRAPVLGIVAVDTLDEAIELQNARGFGLCAGIQSDDPSEVAVWLERTEAGMLFVNQPAVPGSRFRVPFGGWNRSQIGVGWPLGGPMELMGFGEWEPVFAESGNSVAITGVGAPVAALIEAAQPGLTFDEFDRVLVGAQSDERTWAADFGSEGDGIRFQPVSVTIRLAEGAAPSGLVRVLTAATVATASVAISSAVPLHAGLIAHFGSAHPAIEVAEVVIESDVRWRARAQAGGIATTRIRLIGGDPRILARVLHGRPGVAVFAGPITTSGRLELLPFVREQSLVDAFVH